MSGLDTMLSKLCDASSAASCKQGTGKKRFMELAPLLMSRKRVCGQRLKNLSTNPEPEEPTPDPTANDRQRYLAMAEKCKTETKEEEQIARERLEKIKELRSVYLYGLETVAKLQDLNDAPDNYIPALDSASSDKKPASAKTEE